MKENKLIAEFMRKGLPKNFPSLEDYHGEKGLHFHESWNWLMPVVEKIEMLDCVLAVTISTNEVTIESMNEEFTFIEIIRWEDEEPIRGVYKAVVEFIDWYNLNK